MSRQPDEKRRLVSESADDTYGRSNADSRQKLPLSGLAILGLLVVALALLFSSVWSARNVAANQPDDIVNFDRLVKVATCFVVAYLFRSTRMPARRLFPLAVGCLLLGTGLYVVLNTAVAPDMSEYLPVGYLSSLFSGMGNGLVVIVAACALSTFPVWATAVAVPICYLLTETVYFALSYGTFGTLLVLRPTLGLIGLAFVGAALLLIRRGGDRSEGTRGEGVREDNRGGNVGHSMGIDLEEAGFRFLGSPAERPLVSAGMFLIPLIFGVISQVGSTGSPLPGLYDVANEAAAIGVLFLLAVYGAVRGARFSYGDILSRTAPLLATGCILMPITASWDVSAGQVLVKCGYALSQAMLWMLLARDSHAEPHRACLYFGVFYGVFELGTLTARASVRSLTSAFGIPEQLSWVVALLALWLIGVYGFALYSAALRGRRTEAGIAGAAQAGASSPAATRSVDSANIGAAPERLEAFCETYGLSAREKEVLTETLHGYSMETIGGRLYISRDTVKTHLQRIYRKAGVVGKQELIAAIEGYQPGIMPDAFAHPDESQ